MTYHEQSEIWGRFWELINIPMKLLSDYEKFLTHKDILKTLPYAELAYIDSIIIHVAKPVSVSKNETFRLEVFKSICRPEIKTELENIENKYKSLIGKILTNRDKLVAHLDKKAHELCFSENEITRMEKDMATGLNISLDEAKAIYASMPRSADKSKERYSIEDFRQDFPAIKEMVIKLNDIWKRSIPFG